MRRATVEDRRAETGALDTPLPFGDKITRPSMWVTPVLTTLKNVTPDHATAGAPSSSPAAKRVSATSPEHGSYDHIASSLAAGSCGPATRSGQHVAGARTVDRHGRGEVQNVPPSEALYIMIRRAADGVYQEDWADPLARQRKGPGPRRRPGEQHSSPACRREARGDRHLPRSHNPSHLLAGRNALIWSAQRPGVGRTVAPGGECRRSADDNTTSRCARPNLFPDVEHRSSDMEPPRCVSLHHGQIDATHSSRPTEGSFCGRARRDLVDACSSEGPRLRPSIPWCAQQHPRLAVQTGSRTDHRAVRKVRGRHSSPLRQECRFLSPPPFQESLRQDPDVGPRSSTETTCYALAPHSSSPREVPPL